MSKQSDLVNITQGDTITVDHDNSQVGIGTSSPEALLNLAGTNSGSARNVVLQLEDRDLTVADGDIAGAIEFYTNDAIIRRETAVIEAKYTGGAGSSKLHFKTGPIGSITDSMVIDTEGHLLVGTTTTSIGSTSGIVGYSTGLIGASRSGGIAGDFNRLSSDGDIVDFRKDGTTVGSIGVGFGDLYIGTDDAFLRFHNSANAILPATSNGSLSDNFLDLGGSSARFDDVYATNGTIQTSDRNEKQDIETLSDAEQRVAQACKGLLRKFRWIDAVEEKGDNARIHFGIIAQDLQAAFAAEGLDAGDYAMFISSTWWETQTEVPAVEAVEEVVDEDGNVITEAVEAKEAYTRTDTYETAEEAPEGATERTRLGVRYPELLAFIIGAM